MRKIAIAFLALAVVAIVSAPAYAVTLMIEEFNYSNGNLAVAPSVSGGNWVSHSGTSGTDIQVVGGVAVGDNSQAYDDNRGFAAQGATAKTYACFKARIPSGPGNNPRSTYFAHFSDGGTSVFSGRVFVAPQGASFSFGLSVSSSTMGVQWPTALSYDTWYMLVLRYDAAAGSADLWVNPISEASQKITAVGGQVGNTVSAFALRQSNAGSGNLWSWNVDNIAVGTGFEFICPAPTPTDESTWGRLKVLYRYAEGSGSRFSGDHPLSTRVVAAFLGAGTKSRTEGFSAPRGEVCATADDEFAVTLTGVFATPFAPPGNHPRGGSPIAVPAARRLNEIASDP